MPPGRKKGATKADNLAKFSVGDLVLAKVKGFPAWPAKISRAEDWKREPDPKKVFVHFFGTGEIAFVAPADVQVFNVEARKSLLARLQGKSIKYFAKAVREICDAHDKPNSQDPISSSENGSMTSEGPLEVQVNAQSEEACAVAVLRDDDRLDESGKEPQNLLIDGNESVTDHSMTKFDDTKASTGAQSPSKIASTEVSNNHAPLGEDVTRHQSKDTLMKSTDKPKSAYYTKGSRIKKLKLETDGFEGVTNNENIDSKQKEVIGDGDSGKAAEECMRKKTTNNKSATESLPAALKSDSEAADVKKKGSLVKSKKVLKVEGKADVPKNQMRDDLSGRKRKAQVVSKKADVADTDLSCPDSVKSNGEISDEGGKKPQVKRRKVDPSSVTEEKDEKHPETNLRDQTSAVPETGNVEDGDSNVETALAKECVLALEASSASVRTSEKKVVDKATPDVLPSTDPKPLSNLSRTKRRAVCIVGDVEERPRTPVHRGSSQKAKASTPAIGPCVKRDGLSGRSKASQRHNEDCTKSEATPLGRCSKSSKSLIESTDSPEDMVKIKSKGNTSLPVSHAPRRTEFEKLIDSTGDQALGSSQAPLHADAKKIVENHKGIHMSSKIMSSGDLKKTQVEVSGSQSVGMSQAGNPTLRNKSTPGDRPKITSKVRPKLNHAETETLAEKRSSLVGIQRVDIEDPSSVLIESRMSESDKSMRLLIAAAQAKRTAARSQSIAHPVNTMFDPVGSVVHKNSSPGMMEDLRRVNSMTATLSPSMFAAQIPSEHQIGTEKHEGRVSSSHQSTRGSLSGGTEAAVARDAFEGMIETLSRTKESIGRATRLAIDCAKYGIATEVVELLIRKLENEPNLHHRVDLFFLVDSIMQCSHNQKGIAGASYATTVEGALPRLLSAAAPSGSGARENRRQCLKVLRLWLERKIFPATVLRRYMDDIGVSNGDASGSTSFKRPSRAERSVDDPIREMEGMLVDEYGSNAAMQLPSFLTSRIFEDEDDNLLSTLSKVSDEAAQTSDENQELLVTHSSDTRSCTPKNLNGELEMEDVFGQRKDDCPSNDLSEKDSLSQQGVPVPAGRCNETTSNNCHDFPPLPLVSSSPSPPLPSSPAPSPPPPPPQQSPPPPPPPQSPPPPLSPPPPPPPSSPPPPPPHPPHPPPFPSHPHPQSVPSHVPSYPSHAPFTSIAAPPSIPLPPSARPMFMPLMRSQYAVSPQNTLSSQPLPAPQLHTSQLAYQPCGPSNTPGEIQPIPNRCNAIHGQYGPVIPAVTVPAPPPQPLSSHFSYANSGVQQGPYHTSYGLHPPPDGNRPFGTESQFAHNPQNMWSSGGTGPSPSQPFVQEGYYQQASQRPITNNLGFQQSSNSMPAGALVPGHGAVHIWPRPDIAASNSWRPA